MTVPTLDYRRTQAVVPGKLHKGLDKALNGLVGRYRRNPIFSKSLQKRAEFAHDMADDLRKVSDRRLRDGLGEMRDQLRRQRDGYRESLPHVLAHLVEVADRTVGLRCYPVQVMGAMALDMGHLVEMATGEGKSLTACLPAVIAAWSGLPCHFVTVNDYLADRDAAEMRPFYAFCGVSVGCVTGLMDQKERRSNYDRGVVYTTSKELLADFLRDRLQLGSLHQPSRRLLRQMLQPQLRVSDDLVMRGLDTAIVDEADSVLIDEAVTPLIISRAQENRPLVEACQNACKIADSLELDTDYSKDEKYREITLSKEGLKKVESLAGILPGIWQGSSRRVELIQQALTAREFYKLDRQYVIQDGKAAIVDEFTGRLMPNRTWSHGLHQAVEAKEGIEITNPSETLARLSFQRFFRLFRCLSGMTGTAQEAASEFWHIYGLPVIAIPTNRPCIREQLPDTAFADSDSKWQAIVDTIVERNQTRRPVLVGTRSVGASERLARMLDAIGLEYNLMNAVRHKEEANIVAAAGEPGRITIATNMAGRGTDIKLGRSVAELGGLHVIATERHESGRIDRQLFGRCARQGDPGSAQAFVSAEDELMKRFLRSPMRTRLASAIGKKRPGANRLAQNAILYSQRAAQRLAYQQRSNVLRMDTWLDEALSFTGGNLRF